MASALFTGSKHALLYSKFRPSPPTTFINSIIKYLKCQVTDNLKQAVDIGCGSGQSTIALAPYFDKVIGFDISEAQIKSARSDRLLTNVEYKVSDCSKLPLLDASIQLVTSSQAIHWFNLSELFTEIRRILVPNGVVSVYGYWIPLPKTQNEEQDKKIAYLIDEEFHENQLGKYWHKNRYVLKNYYTDIHFPFKDIRRFDLTQETNSTLADYMGYLSSWSAYQILFKEDSENAKRILLNIENQLASLLGQNKTKEETSFPVHTDFFMLMGHK